MKPTEFLELATLPREKIERISKNLGKEELLERGFIEIFRITGSRAVFSSGAATLLLFETLKKNYENYRKVILANLLGSLIFTVIIFGVFERLFGRNLLINAIYVSLLGSFWYYIESQNKKEGFFLFLLLILIFAVASSVLL